MRILFDDFGKLRCDNRFRLYHHIAAGLSQRALLLSDPIGFQAKCWFNDLLTLKRDRAVASWNGKQPARIYFIFRNDALANFNLIKIRL